MLTFYQNQRAFWQEAQASPFPTAFSPTKAKPAQRSAEVVDEAAERSCGFVFWEEERRNERETTFDAKHKKVVANDMQSATTWQREKDSTCPAGQAGSRLWRAPGTPFTPAPVRILSMKKAADPMGQLLFWQREKDSKIQKLLYYHFFRVKLYRYIKKQCYSVPVTPYGSNTFQPINGQTNGHTGGKDEHLYET